MAKSVKSLTYISRKNYSRFYKREVLMDALRVIINNPFNEHFYGKWKKKKKINILIAFLVFHKSDVKTFLK